MAVVGLVLSGGFGCGGADRTAPTVVDSDSIEHQIEALFPAGPALRDAAMGKIGAARSALTQQNTALARTHALALVDLTLASARDGKLSGGKTAATRASASRLVDAVYQLVSLEAPKIPDGALTDEGAAQVVGPAGGTVVTPNGVAGVQFPAGALPAEVLVTIVKIPATPAPGSGPLPTNLKQYPPYYEYSTSPAVTQFGDSARVGICQVSDPANPLYPPGPHERLRLGHAVGPAKSTLEVLPRVDVADFLRCGSVSPIVQGASSGSMGAVSMAHGGLGGKTKSFSPFGAVDPFITSGITVGAHHACALTANGTAYCWGANDAGQVGDQTNVTRLIPVPVAGSVKFKSISAGDRSTCGLSSSGTTYCWGDDVGNSPVMVNGGIEFQMISAAYFKRCGLTATGKAYCWYGTNRPEAVSTALSFTSITVGLNHTCALTAGGTAYCWGENGNGQLGDATFNSLPTPNPTAVSGALTFRNISAGNEFTCAVTTSSQGYCWGRDNNGELGDSLYVRRSSPKLIKGGAAYEEIATGYFHACGTTGGASFCWGANAGRLGIGTPVGPFGPTVVAGALIFKSISPGLYSSCGLAITGLTYCWGSNATGELGDGTTTSRMSPTFVSPP